MPSKHPMQFQRHRALPALALSSLLLLSGCAGLDAGTEFISGITDYITGGDDNSEPPAALTEYTQEVQIDVLWKDSVGDGADKQYLKLVPIVRDARIFAADHNGIIAAFNSGNGDAVWKTKTDFLFSAGPGLGVQKVIIGTSHAEVVAFDIFSGEQKWTAAVPSEVQAVPMVAQGIVIVRTTDGKVIALREDTGTQIWSFEHSVPALSIRGTGNPVIIDNSVIVGSANGKLTALQLKDGKSLWEATVAIPSGRSEIERLVDLDADPVASRGAVFVASYQGGTSSISEADGDVIWRNQDISSYSGLSADFRHLYVSDTHGDVVQLDQRNGAALWKQKELHNRQLTGAVAYQNYVVVGDLEGYVHWLSLNDGRQMGRVQVAKSPIEAKPVVVDGIVYVYAKDGTLAALKAK